MSSSNSDEDSFGDAQEAAEDHTFDPEPTQQLSPGEPQSPLWLPALGLVLFVIAGVFLTLRDGDESAQAASSATSAAAVSAAASIPALKLSAQPPGKPSAPPRRLTPEQLEDFKERMRRMREQRQKNQGAPLKPQ